MSNHNFVTWPHKASEAAHTAALLGVIVTTTYLIGTPYAVGFASLVCAGNWRSTRRNSLIYNTNIQIPSNAEFLTSGHNFEEISSMVTKLSSEAGLLTTPKVVITNFGNFLAGSTHIVAANKNLLPRLTMREKYSGAAHEVAHLALGHLSKFGIKTQMLCYHLCAFNLHEGIWNTYSPLFQGNTEAFSQNALITTLSFTLAGSIEFSRYLFKELQADKGAARLTGDPAAMISCLRQTGTYHSEIAATQPQESNRLVTRILNKCVKALSTPVHRTKPMIKLEEIIRHRQLRRLEQTFKPVSNG